MDAMIKMMLQGYFDGLDAMHPTDPAMQQEVEDFKKELNAFGETQNDVAVFFTNFQDAGLMGKYMDLTAKISMASQMQAQPAQQNASQEPQEKHRVTPQEWLEPFKTAYDYIKGMSMRERGLAVYRRLFELGEQYSDITEFLVAVEKEELLWKICSEDTLGILAITLTGMDPLYEGLTYPTRKNLEAWQASVCEADAYYLQDIFADDIAKNAPRLLQVEHYVLCLGAHLMAYRGPKGKEGIMAMIATGNCPRQEFQIYASNMFIAKQQARRSLEILDRALGMSFEDILSDEYLKYKLIATSNVCGLSRAYVQPNANLIDILADTVRNEIIPDISLIDAVRREASLQMGRWIMPESPEHEKAGKMARQAYKDLPYFQYEDQLQNGSIHVGTGDGFEIKLPQSK